MKTVITRRDFLLSTVAAAALSGLPSFGASVSKPGRFSFILLGDLHFDKLEHHDMAWLQKNKPDDVRQVQDYSRKTKEITPQLFSAVRQTIDDLNRKQNDRVAFVLQVGDLVEGLCGSEELATRQNTEALAFVRESKLGVPFLFAKGNHDITGEGAAAAFNSVFHPFLAEQGKRLDESPQFSKACYTASNGNTLFCFFDAYDKESLEWLEAALNKRNEENCFVIVHPPVVPYGARSLWHLYSAEKQRSLREKFLGLLAKQRAYVLGGHIHRYNELVHESGNGRFFQLAISSIINTPVVAAKTVLSGTSHYSGDQVKVEPAFSPATELERRAVYERERPFVKHFEYADLPGYAVVTVDGRDVKATVYGGTTREIWKTVNMSALLFG